MTRPLIIFGAEGQVGWELQRSLVLLGPLLPLGRGQVDLADPAAVRAAIRDIDPSAIINAGAFTAVDLAESEEATARAVNEVAPATMAAETRALGIPLVHFSTDYVYDGDQDGPYLETDPPNPRSVYGRSKLAGDEAIAASGADYLILRTSWVFAARGQNFLQTILRLAAERSSLTVVADQFGAPTAAELLADVTARALPALQAGTASGGIYHCTAAGETSWYDYARFIVGEAGKLGASLQLGPEQIKPISTAEYPRPAARPANSRLDCRRLEQAFGLTLPPWQFHVKRALKELLAP